MSAAATAKSKAASAAQPGAVTRASGALLNAVRLARSLPDWSAVAPPGLARPRVIAAVLPTHAELRAAEQVLADAILGPPVEPAEIVAAVRWLLDAFPPAIPSPAATLIETLLREATDDRLTGTILATAILRVAREAKFTPSPAHVIAAASAIHAEAETAHHRVTSAIRLRKRAEAILAAARSPP